MLRGTTEEETTLALFRGAPLNCSWPNWLHLTPFSAQIFCIVSAKVIQTPVVQLGHLRARCACLPICIPIDRKRIAIQTSGSSSESTLHKEKPSVISAQKQQVESLQPVWGSGKKASCVILPWKSSLLNLMVSFKFSFLSPFNTCYGQYLLCIVLDTDLTGYLQPSPQN